MLMLNLEIFAIIILFFYALLVTLIISGIDKSESENNCTKEIITIQAKELKGLISL